MFILKLIDKFLNFILICFFIIAISFSGYALYDMNMIQNDIKLEGDILKYKPEKILASKTTFDLDKLQTEVNDDICGWLQIDGTNIDYPIMFPSSPLEYLSKAYDGSYSVAGSIFIDSKNDRYFNDDYTVIYGHNVADKLMFADIKKFKDTDFFNKNTGGKLYIKDEVYNIKIYSFNILDSNKDIAYSVDKYRVNRNADLINNFNNSVINKSNLEITDSDKFILLSTCNGAGTFERAVLFCKLEKSDDTTSEISNVDKDKTAKEAERQERKTEDKIKDYNPDRGNSKQNVIKTHNMESVFKNLELSVINILYNYLYLVLIGLLVITIIIYLKIFKIKKESNRKKTKHFIDDDEII